MLLYEVTMSCKSSMYELYCYLCMHLNSIKGSAFLNISVQLALTPLS